MTLQSLVLGSDDPNLRVLRRVLSDLEIGVDHCTDLDSAVRELSRRRFEAVIVDCEDENSAARLLTSVRSAPGNRRAIAVALLASQAATQEALALGAHFALHKPVSFDRARSSLCAARSLMKCERRRHLRVAVKIPVTVSSGDGKTQERAMTSDIGEGGMAVQLSRQARMSSTTRIRFGLPATQHVVECAGEVAWENAGSQAGVRFLDMLPEQRNQLRSWLARHTSGIEPDDPPLPCKLTDLSPGACYLEMIAPFPVRTRLWLLLKLPYLSLRIEGVVQIAHPEVGMGVEFIRTSQQQCGQVDEFVHALMSAKGELPALEVQPQGIEDLAPTCLHSTSQVAIVDPLVELFLRTQGLGAQEFQAELRKQRACPPRLARSGHSV